jgi:hypothetical protein
MWGGTRRVKEAKDMAEEIGGYFRPIESRVISCKGELKSVCLENALIHKL